MIVQHRNQANRECLYAWYPEAVSTNVGTTLVEPRDIYIHTGIDRTLLVEQNPQGNRPTSADASKNRTYHTNDTIDEALRTPWALDFDIVRRPATPNLPTQTNEAKQQAGPRRLASAPLLRSNPPPTILAIPEPRLVVAAVPTTTVVEVVQPRARASSAKARLNTILIEEKAPARREIYSAHRSRRKDSTSLSEEEIQQIFQRVYGSTVTAVATPPPAQPAIKVIYTQPVERLSQSPLVHVYTKSSSWTPVTISATTDEATGIDVAAIPLNPHYIHRPGVIAIRNQEKRSLIRASSAPRRQHRKRTEPLRAFAPVATKNKISLEIDGMKLTYDPKLTLDDRSSNLTKYFIDGRLYLIKNQRYNIIENVDLASIKKSNRYLTATQRTKHGQLAHRENPQRYVVYDNLNINKMSLGKRPTSGHVSTWN